MIVMAGMAATYFLLSAEVGGVLAGFGYTFGAMMAILSLLSMTGRSK